MKCEESLPLMNAWLDGEIADNDRAALESHLGQCGACQAASDELRLAHSDLSRAFHSERDAACGVAESVISTLGNHSRREADDANPEEGTSEEQSAVVSPLAEDAPSGVTSGPFPRGVDGTGPVDWRSLALAVAVGFLFALVLFPPSAHRPKPGPPANTAERESSQPESAQENETPEDNGFSRIATLVAATGDVQFDVGTGIWSDASQPQFQCPSDSRVRTSKGARAELVTADGAVIRMNGDTEVRLKSPREVELQKGQVFCRAPDDVSIEVYSCETPVAPASPKVSWSASGSGKGFLTTVSPEGGGQIVSTPSCSVSVRTETGRHQLKPGESARIINGQVDRAGLQDPLLAASWIHPLLTQKGHDDPELKERVDELLAQIGRNKMSMLYEREIRSLGEYCVLPLIRYVQSPISRQEPGRRGSAMAIVADLAPSIAIGELISLLEDESPEVRFQTARALLRLTGETLGRSPTDWQKPLPESRESVRIWKDWWQQNGHRFPGRLNSLQKTGRN